jgi:hypothetical protein
MRIFPKTTPPLPKDVERAAERELRGALNAIKTEDDRFVVNPTKWYLMDGNQAKPLVMNRAPFLSNTFQQSLHNAGWTKEKKLSGQTIDAFKVFTAEAHDGRFLGREQYVQLMKNLLPQDNPQGSKAPPLLEAYYWYLQRKKYALPDWAAGHEALFSSTGESRIDFRIGVEFETGNIASSFRALLKLGLLFQLGEIDVGVFITSESKDDGATKIWPVSNRNGSFEELSQRQYKRFIHFPIWELGFAPDAYSRDAEYFQAVAWLYRPAPEGEVVTDRRGRKFDVFTRPLSRDGKRRGRILRPRWLEDERELEEEAAQQAAAEEEEEQEEEEELRLL